MIIGERFEMTFKHVSAPEGNAKVWFILLAYKDEDES